MTEYQMAEFFRSLGHNTPLVGEKLRGRVLLTVAGGRLVHQAEEPAVA